jgi:hypothetical protein
MLRTFFIASAAAAGVLVSSVATADHVSGVRRPLLTAVYATTPVTPPVITLADHVSGVRRPLVALA